ncbi:hypothetical protein BDV96DRAFT_163086 [Lophiotrema nucula]|uniref:Uncharacterized protein n=1 Tax=Lophiotrema nucula TaxID=690887 RepID=A0A6A5Z293_9PLEO|nr:hypothetical protein BDV96DRAFT_163086 [Lophiotrema nucula]
MPQSTRPAMDRPFPILIDITVGPSHIPVASLPRRPLHLRHSQGDTTADKISLSLAGALPPACQLSPSRLRVRNMSQIYLNAAKHRLALHIPPSAQAQSTASPAESTAKVSQPALVQHVNLEQNLFESPPIRLGSNAWCRLRERCGGTWPTVEIR